MVSNGRTHPTEEDLRAEYEALRQRVGERPIEALVDLPLMSDPDLLALMQLLRSIHPPAFYTERKLQDLALLRMANLSLEHGYCDGSPEAFAMLSITVGPSFGHYGDGYRFGHLGAALSGAKRNGAVSRRGLLCGRQPRLAVDAAHRRPRPR